MIEAVGILVALLHRVRTGQGQYVEHAQLNATMAMLEHVVRRPDGRVLGAGRLDHDQLGVSPASRLHATADGWICTVGDIGSLDLATLTTADAAHALDATGVAHAIPVPYNNEAFLNDPENFRAGRVAQSPHPTLGRIRELAKLVRLSHSTIAPHRRAPMLGEHTDEILRELGYDDDQIATFHQRGVVRSFA